MGRRSGGAGARPDRGDGSGPIDSAGRAGRADDRDADAARIAERPGFRQRPYRVPCRCRNVARAGRDRPRHAPGKYRVEIDDRSGSAGSRATHVLVVQARAFPTRTVTVAEAFVNPPAEVAARIQQEAQELAQLWPSSARTKLWDGAFVRPVADPANSAFGARSIFTGSRAARTAARIFSALPARRSRRPMPAAWRWHATCTSPEHRRDRSRAGAVLAVRRSVGD